MKDETLDPEDRNKTRVRDEENAFRESEAYEWNGRTLEPFGFVRITAAIALGLRYGRLTADEITETPNPDYARKVEAEAELEKVREQLKTKRGKGLEARAAELKKEIADLADEPEIVSTYDGMLMDAAIVLWLCSQPDSACQRARRKPREYDSVIDKWAEAEGIGTFAMQPAMELFGRIMAHYRQSQGQPKVEGESSNAGN